MTTPYQPTARRPIGAGFRKTAEPAVRYCVRTGVHPDTISYLSVVCAAAAAAALLFAGRWPWLLLVAPPFCMARLYCNMLDGMVALASGKASLRGEIVNELPDRISDMLIFAGLAHGGLAHPAPAYWCGMLAVLTAYVGILGQAVGAKRQFGGIMAKQWRMVALSIGAVAAWIGIVFFRRRGFGGYSLLDYTAFAIILGCLQTCWHRLRIIDRTLASKKEGA